ncbi:MAG: hypothetical protein AAFO96_03745 [Bacteroidota bacterium]
MPQRPFYVDRGKESDACVNSYRVDLSGCFLSLTTIINNVPLDQKVDFPVNCELSILRRADCTEVFLVGSNGTRHGISFGNCTEIYLEGELVEFTDYDQFIDWLKLQRQLCCEAQTSQETELPFEIVCLEGTDELHILVVDSMDITNQTIYNFSGVEIPNPIVVDCQKVFDVEVNDFCIDGNPFLRVFVFEFGTNPQDGIEGSFWWDVLNQVPVEDLVENAQIVINGSCEQGSYTGCMTC